MSHPRLLHVVIRQALEDLDANNESGAHAVLYRAMHGDYSRAIQEGVQPPFVTPSAMERLVGAAKLYVKARDEDDELDVIEAIRHLQEAIIDYGVARWIAALDD